MTRLLKITFGLCLICLVGTTTFAEPFEQLFRIMKFSGDCDVKPAGSTTFIKAQEGKAYAYGTTVKTGRKSSALILLSEGNECRVLAKAEVTMQEGAMDPKLKIINLKEGKIEVALEKNLEQYGNSLNVETPTAVCGALGTEFTIEVHMQGEIYVVVFSITDGVVTINGMNFDMNSVTAGTVLSIAADAAKSFTRIKNIKGEFDIDYKDSQGGDKTTTTVPETIVKIWRRRANAGSLVIVTVIVSNPDGTTEPAEVYTVDMPNAEDVKLDAKESGTEKKKFNVTIDEDAILNITTTTTTTTTTTQPESITPVGEGRG